MRKIVVLTFSCNLTADFRANSSLGELFSVVLIYLFDDLRIFVQHTTLLFLQKHIRTEWRKYLQKKTGEGMNENEWLNVFHSAIQSLPMI